MDTRDYGDRKRNNYGKGREQRDGQARFQSRDIEVILEDISENIKDKEIPFDNLQGLT